MAIVDGRTPLDDADASTNWNDFATGTSFSLDTDTVIEGTGAVAETVDSTSVWQGVVFDNGSNRNWAGEHIYFWFNMAAAGLAQEFVVRMMVSSGQYIQKRIATPIVNQHIQTYTGGWVPFVISVDRVFEQHDLANSTPFGTTFRYIGLGARLISGSMPKKQDNIFLDAAYRLAAATPGIRVEGTNGGVPWTWQDILDWSLLNANGMVRDINGVLMVNAPIQFGDSASTSSTEFLDATGKVIQFTNDDVEEDFFGINIAGNGTGTTDVTFGAVVGSGDDRRGAGGGFIRSAVRPFTIDAETDIADIDTFNMYGVTVQGASLVQLSGSTKEDAISCTFFDCGEIQANDAEFLNNTIRAPRGRGLEMLQTNNIKQIDFIAGSRSQVVETFGTPTVSSSSSPSNPYTFSHTVASGSTEVALLVLLCFKDSADEQEWAVTYNSVQMTKIGVVRSSGDDNNGDIKISAWLLYNPTQGSSQTVSITNEAAASAIGVKAINLRGTPDRSRIRTVGSITADITETSITADIVADTENAYSVDMVFVDAASAPTAFDSTGGDATETNEVTFSGLSQTFAVAEVTGSLQGTRTHSWTWTNSGSGCQLSVLFEDVTVEHHVHLPADADYSIDFEGMQFFGFGAAGAPKWHGENSGTNADVTLNASEGANPDEDEFENTDGGTVTVVNTINVTFTGLQDGTEIRIYAQGTTTELAGVENATDGSADNRSFTASLTASTVVDIRFAHTDVNGDTWNVPPSNSILGFTWPSTPTIIPITQVADRVFNNP